MERIEELYLYVIQQQKELDVFEGENKKNLKNNKIWKIKAL